MKKQAEARLSEAIDLFMQGAGDISSGLLGMINRSGGQIYALLFLSNEPLSLDEIVQKLGLSKGNVSMNVRLLEDYNLVRKVWVKGSRRDYYAAERVYPKKVLRDFLENIQSTIKQAITTIERTRAKLMEAKFEGGQQMKKKVEFMLQQLDIISLFYYTASRYFEDFFHGKSIDIELLQRAVLNPEEFALRGQRTVK